MTPSERTGSVRVMLVDVLSPREEVPRLGDRVRSVDLPLDSGVAVPLIHDLLRCDLFDVTRADLPDGTVVSVYVDDNGLLKDDPVVGAWNGAPADSPRCRVLAGNLLVTGGVDGKGYDLGLTDAQWDALMRHLVVRESPDGTPLPMLVLGGPGSRPVPVEGR